jgi:hypothetical protein
VGGGEPESTRPGSTSRRTRRAPSSPGSWRTW